MRLCLLAEGPLRDWMDHELLKDELDAYLAGTRPIGLQVWRWLSLESWSRRYIASDPRVTERAPEAVLHAGRHRSWAEATRAYERELAGASD